MASYCCDIPEEVVFHILIFLPVKSILRFKSVSKSYRDFIESPLFVTQHNRRKRSSYGNLIVKNRDGKDSTKDRFVLLSGEKLNLSSKVNFGYPMKKISLVGTCDGIICLQSNVESSSWDFALWNPAIREFRRLPKAHDRKYGHSSAQFGYDVRSNDYKLVRINMVTATNEEPKCEVEVYSLSTDSWKIILRDIVSKGWFLIDHLKVSRNGIFFWCGNQYNEQPLIVSSDISNRATTMLVSFDVSNGVIRTMPLPDKCLHDTTVYGLDFINDNIVAIIRKDKNRADPTSRMCSGSGSGGGYEFEIWMLREYGVKESWAKLYTIGPFQFCHPRTLLSNNGQFIFVKYFKGLVHLFTYDQATKDMRDLHVHDCVYHVEFLMYNESLVSIKHETCKRRR